MPQRPPNKRAQLVRNVLYGVAAWVLPIVPTLVATRIVIERLGKDEYGALAMFLGFVSYFFTISTGKVAAKYAAEFLASGEPKKVPPVISATLIASTGATLVSTLLVASFAGPIVDDVLQIRGPLRDSSVVAVYVAGATVVSTAAAQMFLLLLQALHRFDRYFVLANAASVAFSLGGLVLAWRGYGFVAILVCNLVISIISGIAALFLVKHELPGFIFTYKIPRPIWLLVGRYAAGIVGYQLFGNLLLLFERGWLTRRFGTAALADYVVPMNLAMYVHAFVASLVTSMFPTLNELLARPDTLRALYSNATKLVLAIVAFSTVSAIVCGKTFLTAWLGPAFSDVSSVLLIVHTITFSVLALNTIAWHVAEGFRAASLNAYATFGWMAVGIFAMLLLSPQWDTVGVGAGRLLGVLPFIPMIFFIEHRFLGGVDLGFWAKSIPRLALCSVACGGVQYLLVAAVSNLWAALAAAAALGAAAFLGTAILTRYFSLSDITGNIGAKQGNPEAG